MRNEAVMRAEMRSTRVLAASAAAVVLAALVFLLAPHLDLGVASLFVGADRKFVGDTAFGRALRAIFETIPFLIAIGYVALYALRRLGGVRVWAPNGAALAVVLSSLALGPGLLTNVILKDHSHRPRPAQVHDFGGPFAFKPFWQFDGDCARNCSFVSGEGSSAFWTVAAALVVPPPLRAVAVGAAVAFGVVAGLLRIAFGGHFLSDTVFAALFTWLVILGCWRAVVALTGRVPGSLRD